MTDPLLQALALAPGPQTAADLRDALRRDGQKFDEFQVLQELRRLQQGGAVRLEGTRWRLLKSPATITIPQPKTTVQPSPDPDNQTATPTHSSGPASQIIAPPPAPAGRWALFRRFCRYYMDCLLQEEAPQLRCYVDNQDDTWITAPEVPWARLAANAGFAISLTREQAAFQRNRVRRGEEECIYLCYPVILVKPREGDRFVVPLFAQPMQADWRAGVLHLEPEGPIAVNGAWLEYAFRQRADREAFLRAMGFLREIGADDDNAESASTGPKDFARLAPDAAHYAHDSDRFAERIQPMQLGPAPDWQKSQPGLYNTAILTLGPRLKYTRSLLRDLRDISEKFSDEDLDRTALTALFTHDELPPQANPPPKTTYNPPPPTATLANGDLAQTRLLHPSQRSAVANSLAETISVVTGPPGTGKSEVVAAMLLNNLLRGQPTLFASKNHQALDAVLPRLNDAVEGGDLIIQTSSRELAQRQNYLGKLQSLLARPPRPDASRGDEYRQQFADLFQQQHAALNDIATIEQARREYESVNTQLAELRKNLPLHAQSDEALARWPGAVTGQQLDIFRTELRRALARPANPLQKFWYWLRRNQIEARRKTAREPLLSLPSPFTDRTLPDAQSAGDAWNDFFTTWTTWADGARVAALVHTCEQRIAQLPQAEDCNRRLANAQQGIEERTREWMAWAAGGLPNTLSPADRESLANLRAGIQNWGPDRFARELRQHFPLILRAFPLWSVSNLSARSALPLLPALFDLVIIDEASQCDIPSVIPLLARSRKAVLAGDPMQLKHVSTLDVAVEQTLLQQYGLTDAQVQRYTYRVNSAFGLANDNQSVPDYARVRLDLHFRSHGLIADYCNEAFYSNTLNVVTLTERLNIPAGMKPGIHWTHVAGKLERGTTGAWSADEIDIIRSELAGLAAGGYRGTIGVVTPFRQQMISLRDTLEASDSLPPEFMDCVRFLAATAHGFQGDERDLILFSLCGGPDMPDGATIFLRENPNLFNVAVSRARAVLHVVGNRDWALNCGVSFIEKLARRTIPGASPAPARARDPYQSPWEKVLADALSQAGVKTIPQYPIAGRFLDLAVLNPIKIDLEVDGESVHRTAGGGRKDDDHWRDLQLQSLGWKVCRFWVYELREALPKCVARVLALLTK
jgi:very-short-patch-repair endonuclease